MAKIVILGLGAAGFGAALAIKKHDRKAEITILDNKDFDLMHQCGLPWAIEGKTIKFSCLKSSLGLDKMGIKLVSKATVDKIDFDKKIVHSDKGEVNYDKLIIATGSKPFTPPIKTENKTFTVHKIDDSKELQKHAKKGEKAIIIGAGAIGLEVAVALRNMGMKVTILDMLPTCFPKAIDKDMSDIIEEYIKEKGIKIELGKKIEEIKEKALVIMATGVRPNIDFLDNIKTNRFGIVVNDKMETSIKDVYAAGDCCCVSTYLNKEQTPSQLANNSYREGSIAGINAAGGNKKYPGILNTFVSVIDHIEVAATGFNSFFADMYKIKTTIGKAKAKNKPKWFGPAGDITVKILADEKGKVIGAQAVGEGAKERINIIATAIKGGLTLKDVSELELAYCPAVSDYYDVLVMAAELGLRKIK